MHLCKNWQIVQVKQRDKHAVVYIKFKNVHIDYNLNIIF